MMISLTQLAPQHFTIFRSAAEEVASHRRDRDDFTDDAEPMALDALTDCEPLKGGLMTTRHYALGTIATQG